MRGRGSEVGRSYGRGRVVLVIDEDPELAVALGDRLDRAYVTVCGVDHAEAGDAALACIPCAWMVVGTGTCLAADVAPLLARQPALVLWRGEAPPGLPRHTRTASLYSDLAQAVERAIFKEVAGMRLAPGSGITMPDGRHARSAALEALVGGHPDPVFAPARYFHAAAAALQAHRVAARVSRTSDGGARLVAQAV